MSDRDGFIRAILAAPDDDAPRLEYADWLDEHGDAARAEFIRVQCKLAAETPTCGPCKLGRTVATQGVISMPCAKHEPMRCREDDLALDNARKWLKGLGLGYLDYCGPGNALIPPQPRASIVAQFRVSRVRGAGFRYAVVRRGFMAELTLTAADCLARLDAIRREHPVRKVTLTTWPNGPEVEIEADDGKPIATGGPAEREYLRRRWHGIDFNLPPSDTLAVGSPVRDRSGHVVGRVTDIRRSGRGVMAELRFGPFVGDRDIPVTFAPLRPVSAAGPFCGRCGEYHPEGRHTR